MDSRSSNGGFAPLRGSRRRHLNAALQVAILTTAAAPALGDGAVTGGAVTGSGPAVSQPNAPAVTHGGYLIQSDGSATNTIGIVLTSATSTIGTAPAGRGGFNISSGGSATNTIDNGVIMSGGSATNTLGTTSGIKGGTVVPSGGGKR